MKRKWGKLPLITSHLFIIYVQVNPANKAGVNSLDDRKYRQNMLLHRDFIFAFGLLLLVSSASHLKLSGVTIRTHLYLDHITIVHRLMTQCGHGTVYFHIISAKRTGQTNDFCHFAPFHHFCCKCVQCLTIPKLDCTMF